MDKLYEPGFSAYPGVSPSLAALAVILNPVITFENIPELSEKQWIDLFELSRRHKLTTPLYAALSPRKAVIPSSCFKVLHEAALERSTRMLSLLGMLLQINQQFEQNDIAYLSLKGPALSVFLYGDISQKQSGDLDLLVDTNDIWKASDVLLSMGFETKEIPRTLTLCQRQHMIRSYHHFVFFHPQKKLLVELHWRVNTNRRAEPFSFEQMLENSIKVRIGEVGIPALSVQHAFIHQFIHGAGHAWFAMAWLRDTITLAQRSDVSLNEVWKWAVANGYDRMMAQALLLGERVFGLFLSDMLRNAMKNSLNNHLTLVALNALISKEVPEYLYAPKFLKVKQKIYLMKLKRDFSYKCNVWSVLLTHPRDWQALRLPDSMFFLYYPLRPFLYFWTVYVKKMN
jgi:hypothetical protein